jgi:hypothetical protein
MAYVILAFILAVGPLALLFGSDSRRIDDHGFFPAPRR